MSIKAILSAVPDRWELPKFDELISYAAAGDWGESPDSNELDHVEVLCIRASELKGWKHFLGATAALRKVKRSRLEGRQLQLGDILVEISGGGPEQPVGRTVVIGKATLMLRGDTPKICSNFMRVVRVSNDVSPHFIYHYLQLFYHSGEVVRYQGGSNNLRNLKFGDYIGIQIPMPSLVEQQRIVAKIEELFSELDKGIENLKLARAQLAVYRQALLKHAFEGKLTADWRTAHSSQLASRAQLLARVKAERDSRSQELLADWQAAVRVWEAGGQKSPKPSKPRKVPDAAPIADDELFGFSELPYGWTWMRLGASDCNVFDGPFGSNLKTSDYVGAGVRVIRLENIGVLKFIGEKESFISAEKYRGLTEHTVFPGDIVFSSFVTDQTRVALVPKSVPKAVNKSDCFCIRLHGPSLLNRYACVFLSTRLAYKQLEAVIHGVGRPRVNTTQLKDLFIPICSSAEQLELMERLDAQFAALDELEKTAESEIQRSEALRQSILKKAFAGELVPQDPNDEPASALLDRIRTGRQAGAKAPKAARKVSLGRKKV